MMRVFLAIYICFCMNLIAEETPTTPEAALKRLMTGNERYVHDALLHPDRTYERRQELKVSQNPFAIIVGCSDSRVSPEIVFDQGIGDLFVVRLAGNVIDPVALDSIYFAAQNLGASIVVVLGHENCSAVSAVLHHNDKDIPDIAKLIQPAVTAAEAEKSANPLQSAVKMNVRMVVEQIKKFNSIPELMGKKKIDVIGGYYHLGSGEVELIK